MRNTSNRSRNGIHKLHCSLNRGVNRGLGHACNRFATTLLGGARRPRQPNLLSVACGLITQYLRMAKRAARQDPHLFGPHSRRYFLETLALERHEQECQAAVREVYGPPAPGEPVHVSTLWSDRYFPEPKHRRLFLKWFHERYPSP